MEYGKNYRHAHLYVPVLTMRNAEIKWLSKLNDAFAHKEVVPFLEIVKDFKNPIKRGGRLRKDGTRGDPSYDDSVELSSILKSLPNGKTAFVGLYRNLEKCQSRDFPTSYPYLESLKDPARYLSESISLFQFPNVIPVFEMNSKSDSDYALPFLDEARRQGRRVGIRLNTINKDYLGVLQKLSDEDYLFLNLGEGEVESVYFSILFYKDYGISGRLVTIGENHPAALKTTELAPTENEQQLLHGDYFDGISPYPEIVGAGDYCSIKNVLVDSFHSKTHYCGKANFLVYRHSKKGYLVFTDDAANDTKGYEKIREDVLKRRGDIDPHALSIITDESGHGGYARWNVTGAIHYIYDVLPLVL